MVFYGVYAVRTGNPAGTEIVGADIVFSTMYAAFFAYIMVQTRKHNTDDNSLSQTDPCP